MRESISYIIYSLVVIIAIKGSIEETLYTKDTKNALNRVLHYFSVTVASIIVIWNLEYIIELLNDERRNVFFSYFQNGFVKCISIIVIYIILQVSIYFMSKIFIKILRGRYKQHNDGILIILSTILGIIKSGFIIIILFIGVITINNLANNKIKIPIFENSRLYSNLEEVIKLDSEIIDDLFDSEIWAEVSNLVVYYNGVTLEEGIKSNEDIDSKSISLTEYKEDDIEKARSLYVWIGSNIEYDFEKAEKVLRYDNSENSGAIEAWESKTGICFDYACLYVAMARAAELDVRLITGKAFDGEKYVSHAWNEVYISEEERWVTVDSTFYESGNYFDNYDFYDTHIKDDIAGEW